MRNDVTIRNSVTIIKGFLSRGEKVGVSERKRKETEALRQRVLDVAEDIFAHEGVGQVTMRRIASMIDYAPTVLYRLFSNKNDLMDNLIARGYKGVREEYEKVMKQKNLGPMAALKGILRVYVTYALDHPNHYRMWFDTGRLFEKNHLLNMSHGRLEYVVFSNMVRSYLGLPGGRRNSRKRSARGFPDSVVPGSRPDFSPHTTPGFCLDSC